MKWESKYSTFEGYILKELKDIVPEEDRTFLLKFLDSNRQYSIESYYAVDSMHPTYALRRANFDDHRTTKWETIGRFQRADELIAVVKLLPREIGE